MTLNFFPFKQVVKLKEKFAAAVKMNEILVASKKDLLQQHCDPVRFCLILSKTAPPVK